MIKTEKMFKMTLNGFLTRPIQYSIKIYYGVEKISKYKKVNFTRSDISNTLYEC